MPQRRARTLKTVQILPKAKFGWAGSRFEPFSAVISWQQGTKNPGRRRGKSMFLSQRRAGIEVGLAGKDLELTAVTELPTALDHRVQH